jgi:hypothetical protein
VRPNGDGTIGRCTAYDTRPTSSVAIAQLPTRADSATGSLAESWLLEDAQSRRMRSILACTKSLIRRCVTRNRVAA